MYCENQYNTAIKGADPMCYLRDWAALSGRPGAGQQITRVLLP